MTQRLLITTNELRQIDRLVRVYELHSSHISLFRDQLLAVLTNSAKLAPLVHSIRSRVKESDHLKDKLIRKLIEAKKQGRGLGITPDDLLLRINDLVGVRILHLYTRRIEGINRVLHDVFEEARYDLIEGPFARTWDDESRAYFSHCNIQTQKSPSMYTSVHYVIGSASRTKVTAEIQVRTLMEEVWGEVDHSMNYPHPTNSLACNEQLKVLARVTSSATRLVDSIFLTLEDHDRRPSASRATSSTRAKQPRRR